ncbi:MAG: SEC59/DGK1/VTE5 family protein [Euryarchaeota archaeon]|nr:SEC59/DGK1/VTE5 family protein [Euryarchaeota archaeon]
MIQNDLLGLILVYGYVAVLLFFTEKIVAKKYPLISRKILHILVGNIAFFLPVFQTREIMAFAAAGPFIIFTFLMSPYSPIKSMRGKTSEAGHGFGLVYYAIAWTVLAYFFFDNKEIIAIGILAMSYGDGFASLIGIRYGKRKYKVFGDQKSYVGSLAMALFTFGTIIIALLFYRISFSQTLVLYIVGIAIVSAIVEGVTPKGLDNLSVPFVTALLYGLMQGVVL